MYDIVVIGAGPAGMTAALYAARSGHSVVVLEYNSFGGQIALSPSVENYPSIAQMSGMEFSTNLMNQVMELGVPFEFEKAVKISGEKIKTVETESGNSFECKAVIVATGATHRHLGVEREEVMIGKGVSYCAVCDGAFFKEKDVAIVGGGDTALQDALYLAKICSKVYLIHRRDEFRGVKALSEKVRATENIELVLNSNVSEILGEKAITGIKVKNKIDDAEREITISGLFVAVGQVPQTEVFPEEVLDKGGYFAVHENTISSVKGVFVAGDCRSKSVRQLTTAVGDGSTAATHAAEYITENFE